MDLARKENLTLEEIMKVEDTVGTVFIQNIFLKTYYNLMQDYFIPSI